MPQHPDLQKIVAELSELAGGLAHELRNPLSTIKVHLKLLAEDLADDSLDQLDAKRRMGLRVVTLLAEVDRLQVLFDRFLTVAGPHDLELKQLDVNELIQDLVRFFEPTASQQGIVLSLQGLGAEHSVDSVEQPLIVSADAPKLRQALLNILVNAQEAMPRGGQLTVCVKRDDDRVQIIISDTGIGIRDEELARVERPFFTTKAKGTGLGLAITRRIIRDHNGSIDFTSKHGVGTTVTLSLPLSN